MQKNETNCLENIKVLPLLVCTYILWETGSTAMLSWASGVAVLYWLYPMLDCVSAVAACTGCTAVLSWKSVVAVLSVPIMLDWVSGVAELGVPFCLAFCLVWLY
jgi:hypothetical protein